MDIVSMGTKKKNYFEINIILTNNEIITHYNSLMSNTLFTLIRI